MTFDRRKAGGRREEREGSREERRGGRSSRNAGEGRGESRSFGRRDDKRGDRRDDRREARAPRKEYAKENYKKNREQNLEADENESENEDHSDGLLITGRNAVIEAFRAGKTIDRLFVQEGLQDGPIMTVLREAKKHDGTIVDRVSKERLDQLAQLAGNVIHQGVVARAAAYEYAEVSDILAKAKEKGEAPFIFILDNIEDPHNLGAIIRTANLAGAHGVIIPKRRAVGLTSTVARTSAGALNYTPVAKVTNIAQTIEELKKEGLWFVCAAMDGEVMYKQNLTGPIGLVIGNEGDGVSRLVREKCDLTASIPMKGDIDSLNASVAAGVMAFEIVRQRMLKA